MNASFFLLSFIIALVAIVYRQILAQELILNWWFRFGLRFEKYFFYKPVWGCEFCFAGQIAFWTYLINSIYQLKQGGTGPIFEVLFNLVPKHHFENISAFWGVVFVSVTILLTRVLNYLLKKILQ